VRLVVDPAIGVTDNDTGLFHALETSVRHKTTRD
jgi:hypothetical protein